MIGVPGSAVSAKYSANPLGGLALYFAVTALPATPTHPR